MKYKSLAWLALLVASVCCADNAILDTEALMKVDSDFVKIDHSAKSSDAKSVASVRICPTNVCDLFESDEASSRLLYDYVYLYSVYIGKYVDFSAHVSAGKYQTLNFISDALNKGYGEKLLNYYTKKFHCENDSLKCVLQKLKNKAGIKRFRLVFDEEKLTKTPIEANVD